jgi:hypothetical protein
MRAVLDDLESKVACGATEIAILLEIAASYDNSWVGSLSSLLNVKVERMVKNRTMAEDGGFVQITYQVSRRPVMQPLKISISKLTYVP